MKSKFWFSMRQFIVLAVSALFLISCKKSGFDFNYGASMTPTSSLTLGTSQTEYTQSRTVSLELSASDPYQMAFFIDKTCSYKDVLTWEDYSAQKTLQLPDADGTHQIAVIFRSSAHFPSDCKTVSVTLDRVGPQAPATVDVVSRISTTTTTPNFSFGIATDLNSPIDLYQVRVIKASDNSETLGWTDAGVVVGSQTSLTTVMTSGQAYAVEVRAKDRAGNYGTVKRSATFYAGLNLTVNYINSSGTATACNVTSCALRSGVYEIQVKPSFTVAEPITIQYQTQDVTALNGLDYFATSGSMTIAASAASAKFYLNVRNSYQPGPARTFRVNYTSSLSSTSMTGTFSSYQTDGNAMVAHDSQPLMSKIALGGYTNCGLTTTSEIYCWGDKIVNVSGTLAAFSVSMGWKVTGLASETMVQAQGLPQGGLGLAASKKIYYWGGVWFGSYLDTLKATATPMADFTDITQFAVTRSDQNYMALCGVQTDGTIRCGGSNIYKQLGNGSTATSPTTSSLVVGFAVPGTDPVAKKVVMGSNFACALTTAGAVKCWGTNDKGQLGVNTTTTYSTSAVSVSGLPTMKDIDAGYKQICGVSNDDRLFCWGDNTYGGLGVSVATTLSYTPLEIAGQTGIQSLAIGKESQCMIRRISSVDKVYCWGWNAIGGVGQNLWNYYLTPVEMTSFPGTPISIAAGEANEAMCGINSSNNLYCWGGTNATDSVETGVPYNSSSLPLRTYPDNSQFDIRATDIRIESFTQCVTRIDGTFYCRGINDLTGPKMSLGGTYAIEPAKLSSDNITTFATTKYNESICYLKSDKKVWCKGENTYGQLGNGTTTPSSTYQEVTSLSNVKMISGGFAHFCAVTDTNAIACWGLNDQGQMGLTANTPAYVVAPTLIGGLPAGTVLKIGSTAKANCALYSNGGIYCWGGGANGERADGTNTASVIVPTSVASGFSFTDFAVGRYGGCAVATTGKAYCWGLNTNPRIGDGTTTARNAPTEVLAPAGVSFTTVSTSDFGSCGSTTAGEVYCWGWGGSGQLGNGSTSVASTPVKVSNIAAGAIKVVSADYLNAAQSSGQWYNCALIRLNNEAQDIKCWGAAPTNLGSNRKARSTPTRLYRAASSALIDQ